MSRCQSWSGRSTRKEPGPAATVEPPAALDQPTFAHHAQHALAVHAPAEPPPHPRGHQPVAVGRVLDRDIDDRGLDLVGRRLAWRRERAPGPGDAVDRLPADLRAARHHRAPVALADKLARPGDAHAYSQSRKNFPAISSS